MSILSEYLCNRCHLLSRDEKLNFVKLSDEEVKERVDKYILNLETELRHESKMMSFKDERASALMKHYRALIERLEQVENLNKELMQQLQQRSKTSIVASILKVFKRKK